MTFTVRADIVHKYRHVVTYVHALLMTFPPDAVFTRSPRPVTSEVDGELVMMDVESGNYFNLDSIGTAIWSRLEHPVRFEDLCQDLHGIYDAAPDTIQRDVAALLSRMLAHRLVDTDAA